MNILCISNGQSDRTDNSNWFWSKNGSIGSGPKMDQYQNERLYIITNYQLVVFQ